MSKPEPIDVCVEVFEQKMFICLANRQDISEANKLDLVKQMSQGLRHKFWPVIAGKLSSEEQYDYAKTGAILFLDVADQALNQKWGKGNFHFGYRPIETVADERQTSFKIHLPPGSLLLTSGRFLFKKKYLHSIILPLIADMREEYFEALSQNSIWKARWVRVRGTWSFFSAIGLDRAFALVSFFVKAWKSVN